MFSVLLTHALRGDDLHFPLKLVYPAEKGAADAHGFGQLALVFGELRDGYLLSEFVKHGAAELFGEAQRHRHFLSVEHLEGAAGIFRRFFDPGNRTLGNGRGELFGFLHTVQPIDSQGLCLIGNIRAQSVEVVIVFKADQGVGLHRDSFFVVTVAVLTPEIQIIVLKPELRPAAQGIFAGVDNIVDLGVGVLSGVEENLAFLQSLRFPEGGEGGKLLLQIPCLLLRDKTGSLHSVQQQLQFRRCEGPAVCKVARIPSAAG